MPRPEPEDKGVANPPVSQSYCQAAFSRPASNFSTSQCPKISRGEFGTVLQCFKKTRDRSFSVAIVLRFRPSLRQRFDCSENFIEVGDGDWLVSFEVCRSTRKPKKRIMHPGPPGPGGPHHHGPGGPGGGYGNPIADCLCCPCSLVWYICYAFWEVGNCFCSLGNCFGYDRRPGYGPPPPHHHPPPHNRW